MQQRDIELNPITFTNESPADCYDKDLTVNCTNYLACELIEDDTKLRVYIYGSESIWWASYDGNNNYEIEFELYSHYYNTAWYSTITLTWHLELLTDYTDDWICYHFDENDDTDKVCKSSSETFVFQTHEHLFDNYFTVVDLVALFDPDTYKNSGQPLSISGGYAYIKDSNVDVGGGDIFVLETDRLTVAQELG